MVFILIPQRSLHFRVHGYHKYCHFPRGFLKPNRRRYEKGVRLTPPPGSSVECVSGRPGDVKVSMSHLCQIIDSLPFRPRLPRSYGEASRPPCQLLAGDVTLGWVHPFPAVYTCVNGSILYMCNCAMLVCNARMRVQLLCYKLYRIHVLTALLYHVATALWNCCAMNRLLCTHVSTALLYSRSNRSLVHMSLQSMGHR